jgi:ABC-type nitrate/sulfonate/bicarbonate transport system substrate-binding protein
MASWISTGTWAKSHKQAVTEFRKSLTEADKWITKHPDSAKKILAKYTKQPYKLIKDAPLSTFSTNNPVKSLKQWDPVLRSVGNFHAEVDYNKLIFNP